ncbi:DUF4286 family protein [Namhaeicola litoreus]|uniref:DUF4286 family protein n=1 Tax=Namhaeicola litoreus TaxID=1052145 RepID=A0ABW3Y208_9FLAO
MIIYNVTTNVEKEIEEDWLIWMKTEHIPKVVKIGKFSHALLTKILIDEEMGGITYSVQYTSPSRDVLANYLNQHTHILKQEVVDKFGDKLVSFRTELEVIDLIENNER